MKLGLGLQFRVSLDLLLERDLKGTAKGKGELWRELGCETDLSGIYLQDPV